MPVADRDRISGEAVDEAIATEVACLCAQPRKNRCVALLTGDVDFCSLVQHARDCGLDTVIVVPKHARGPIPKFKAAGAKVVVLNPVADVSPRVRAVLHKNGEGTVQLAEPFEYSFDRDDKLEITADFFQELRYFSDQAYLAKFWYAQKLGSLTVFPGQRTNLTALKFTAAADRVSAFTKYDGNLAFFLPVTAKVTKAMPANLVAPMPELSTQVAGLLCSETPQLW